MITSCKQALNNWHFNNSRMRWLSVPRLLELISQKLNEMYKNYFRPTKIRILPEYKFQTNN